MIVALAGNPNSGKTTLFNELTKLNQKIGNWPGVTIEKKEGKYHLDKSISIIDLPGIYSLSPLSEDERISRDFLINEKPDAVINVIDSDQLERGLALTLELLEIKIPTILALNMEDELKLHGLEIDIKAIEKELNIPVILISAKKKRKLKELMDKVIKLKGDYRATTFMSKGNTEEEKTKFRHKFITSKIDFFRKTSRSKIKKITNNIDKIVMNKWLAFPIFAVIIFLMFYISIQLVGEATIGWTEWLFFDIIGENVRNGLLSIGSPAWIPSLLVDGLISGVGMVLSFVPQIIVLFLFIVFLEGCGYMSRVAVIMDRIFRKIGLSGKSFIPMIVGCGCSVPAIMSAKTIESQEQRRKTIMLTPFIPCSAKLPVFAFIVGALFPNNAFVAPSMYFLGIAMVIIWGLILNLFNYKKKSNDTFIMDLPNYRLPKFKNILRELWDKAKDFIIRAGVVIVPSVIVLWILQSFNFTFQMVDIEDSMLASIGRVISVIFVPLGFGNWQSSIAVITGLFAKETVVSTFTLILGHNASAGLASLLTPQAGYAFMAFILLSAPCVAAIATTKKELGSFKWMFIAIGFQTLVAYLASLVINQLGNLWMYNSSLFITIVAILIIALIFILCIIYIVRRRKINAGCSFGCSTCNKVCDIRKLDKEFFEEKAKELKEKKDEESTKKW